MPSRQRAPLISLWDLLALLGFGGLWVFYLQVAPTLPARVPTHFNATGVANGWTPKEQLPWVIFGIPLLIWGLATLQAIVMAARQEDPDRADAMAMRPLRGLLGLGLAFCMAMCLRASATGPRAVLLGVGVLLALVAVGIILMARGFRKLAQDGSGLEPYKWGLFYVKADDPRLLVPKRYGVGWTFNFARPSAWLIMALVMGALVASIVMARTGP